MSRSRSRRSTSQGNWRQSPSRGGERKGRRSSRQGPAGQSRRGVFRVLLPIGAVAVCCAVGLVLVRGSPLGRGRSATSGPAGAASAAGSGGPRWVCAEPVLDFGQVWEGATVQRDFIFENTGTEVLKIGKPKAHCSCSTTPNYTKEVPPGGSGVIPFVLKTANKPYGPLTEYLTVETNDPESRSVKIYLKGFIRNVVEPEVVYDALYEREKSAGKSPSPVAQMKAAFGRIGAKDRLHRVIKLRNTSGEPLTLTMTPPKPPPPFEVEMAETISGQEYELTIRAEPPIPVGHTSAQIVLQTNVAERPTYAMWINTYVPPRIEVSPPEKMLIDPVNYPQKERQIRIVNNGASPVDVVGISTSDPQYGITLKARDPGKPNEQVIHIELPGGDKYRPPTYGEIIEIRTTDAEVPIIKITIVPSLDPLAPRPPGKSLTMHPVPL